MGEPEHPPPADCTGRLLDLTLELAMSVTVVRAIGGRMMEVANTELRAHSHREHHRRDDVVGLVDLVTTNAQALARTAALLSTAILEFARVRRHTIRMLAAGPDARAADTHIDGDNLAG